MERKTLYAGLVGLALGILANSIEIKTSEPFRFNNPIGRSKEVNYFNGTNFVTEQVQLSEQDIKNIVEKRPEMTDTDYSINIFGLRIPFLVYRNVKDSATGEAFSGRLASNGDIHSLFMSYPLESAHDSSWYKKKR